MDNGNTEFMSSEEAAKFLNIAVSTLYKLSSTRSIPFYKPSGKLIYFKREELSAWLNNGRQKTKAEIDSEVWNAN